MDRYQQQNAAYKINGYYSCSTEQVRKSGTDAERFVKAKAECLAHMRDSIEHVEQLTFDEFRKAR